MSMYRLSPGSDHCPEHHVVSLLRLYLYDIVRADSQKAKGLVTGHALPGTTYRDSAD
jgi:hypothetical protein